MWNRHIKKTVYTLNIGGNYAPDITALTYPLMKRYAEKIGADFFVITERKFPAWPVTFEKLQIYELGQIHQNDWNIYVDGDALVHPDLMDITNHLGKDTVAHWANDVADNRWRYDRFFLRDGRHIGSCDWFLAASDLCIDAWKPPDDISLEEVIGNIYPTNNELSDESQVEEMRNDGGMDVTGIKKTPISKEHLIDDYLVSRNIAKFGLKFTTFRKILENLGYQRPLYIWHTYDIPESEKLVMMKQTLQQWGLLKGELKSRYEYPGNTIQGWMTDDELQWLYLKAKEMDTIVEIGSWKGRSTHALCSGCKKGLVTAVDHFKGSPSEMETTHKEAHGHDIFKQFQANTKEFQNLAILKTDSISASKLFDPKSVDMVFIDGSHEREPFIADVEAWLPIAKKLLCGHDRDQEGVPDGLRDVGLTVTKEAGSIWSYKIQGQEAI